MDLQRCWDDHTRVLTEAVRGTDYREMALFVVRGGPGQGVADVVRGVSHETSERTTLWVDAVTDEHLDYRARISRQEAFDDALLHSGRHAQEPDATGRGADRVLPVAEALHLLGDDHTGHGRLVLVDSFHLMPASDAAVLIEWLQQQRFTDTVAVIGVHPVECPTELVHLLSSVTPTATVELPRLATEQLTELLSVRHPTCIPQSLARIAEFSCGIPSLAFEAADHHCIQAGAHGNGDSLQRSLQLAVLQVSLPILARQRADDFQLGLSGVLAAPEGAVADLAKVLDHSEAARVESLLNQIGLLGGGEDRAETVRNAFLEGADPQHLHSAAASALELLERVVDAPPERVLTLVEILGPEDGNYLAVAKRAVDGFLNRGLDERALALALQAMRRSRCPDVIAWARSVALTLALSWDWSKARKMMLAGGPDDALVRQLVLSGGLSSEFSVDASHAVGTVTQALLAEVESSLVSPPADAAQATVRSSREAFDVALVTHHHLLSGRSVTPRLLASLMGHSGPVRCVELSSLLAAALRGASAERRVEGVQERLTGSVGKFNVGSHRAALLAATHLCLSNHQAATEWSSIATITAGPEDQGSSGLGHAIAALALLRLGQFTEGATHAATATEIFAAIRADHLASFARTISWHIEIEGGRPGTMPEPPTDRCHPVLEVYATYVRARHLLAVGHVDEGVTELFRVGRHLEKLGLSNPTLVNWRPHLISVFRGTSKDDFANIVESDLLRAMRSWHRANPLSAMQRAHILGGRSPELLGDPEETEHAMEIPQSCASVHLSEAESRVVRLVVQGRSNREVARELFLSKRTIDTHLSNVYRKLGLSSRLELTNYVVEMPGTPDPAHSGYWLGDSDRPLYG